MEARRRIDASPEVVWSLLAGTRHWPEWGPSVRAVDPADSVVHTGLRGHVVTPIGVPLPFEVTAVEPGRRWSWSVAGIPATDHVVEPDGEGCVARIVVPRWAPAYAAVCHLALRRIARLAEEA